MAARVRKIALVEIWIVIRGGPIGCGRRLRRGALDLLVRAFGVLVQLGTGDRSGCIRGVALDLLLKRAHFLAGGGPVAGSGAFAGT